MKYEYKILICSTDPDSLAYHRYYSEDWMRMLNEAGAEGFKVIHVAGRTFTLMRKVPT